jgi:dTDP-4-dehydrorhamnose reductase
LKTIWVTGSKGQLGTELQLQQQTLKEVRFIFTDIEELNLTNKQGVIAFCKQEKPAIVINCAAYTAVDKAEEEPEKAMLLNRDVPAFLAEGAKTVNGSVIHISTDYVFDGTSYRPWVETDKVNPQSVYAKTKSAGEEVILKHPENLVIRTSWLYSAHGSNFLKTMIRLGKERKELGVVYDQVGSPTSAADLAGALIEVSRQLIGGKKNAGGLYHYTNEGVCSWYDFARVIMNIAQLSCTIRPITTDQYPLPAKRPFYSVLNKAKIKVTFGIDIPHWSLGLAKTYRQFLTMK